MTACNYLVMISKCDASNLRHLRFAHWQHRQDAFLAQGLMQDAYCKMPTRWAARGRVFIICRCVYDIGFFTSSTIAVLVICCFADVTADEGASSLEPWGCYTAGYNSHIRATEEFGYSHQHNTAYQCNNAAVGSGRSDCM